jgi:hypothetical protein
MYHDSPQQPSLTMHFRHSSYAKVYIATSISMWDKESSTTGLRPTPTETNMRQIIRLKSYNGAKRRCPSAVAIVKVYGGFMAFYDAQDYAMWKKQK